MKFFLGVPIKKIKPTINSFLNLSDKFDVKKYCSTLYYCYTNNIPCIISDNNKTTLQESPGIYYISNTYTLFFKWDYLLSINTFFTKKYKIKEAFTTYKGLFYYIFLIEFIYKNRKLYKTQGIKLLDNIDCFFGIYDNFNGTLTNCNHLLYFSMSLNKFIFYRVHYMQNSIYGKLMDKFFIEEKTIRYKDEQHVNLPNSFIKIKKNIYSIEKKNITIISNENPVKNKIYNSFYYEFLKKNNSRCFFILDSKINITRNILSKLYEYLIAKYPVLNDKYNNVLVDPYSIDISKGNLILILITETKPNKIIIDINQYFVGYIKNIYNTLLEFFDLINKSKALNVSSQPIIFNKDFCIHIISEIMYLYLIIKRSYLIIKNISNSESNKYIQINYTFSEKETAIFKSYSPNSNYSEYLKCLVSTTLSTFLDNYYIFIHDECNIDLIPIYEGIDIDTVQKYLNYSRKANYSKFLLTTYLSKISGFLDKNNLDIPIIFLNISNIPTTDTLNISKIYGNTDKKSIPIIINIVYNNSKLLINLSYKKKYSKMKYFFNELIDTILNV